MSGGPHDEGLPLTPVGIDRDVWLLRNAATVQVIHELIEDMDRYGKHATVALTEKGRAQYARDLAGTWARLSAHLRGLGLR